MKHDLFARLEADFPDVPEAVLRGWLWPVAQRAGWPPDGQGPWDDVLMGRGPAWWQARRWRCEALPMTLDVMSHAVRFQTTRLVEAARAGQDIAPGSRARIASVQEYIVQTGTWPAAPVAFPDSGGLGLADGHHRLAALEMARGAGVGVGARHRVWIALPPPHGAA